ncbi:MAG: damage-control phosphatase ARMT1 family protein [Chloroflexota bacterium]
MPAPANLPPPIRTDGTNPFAYHTMGVRQPDMILKLLDANPHFSPMIREELLLLRDDLIRNSPVFALNLFPTPPPDYIDWASAIIDRGGERNVTWLNTDWFFAETLFFRLIVEATRYFETGEDPYAPFKTEEIKSEALWTLVERAVTLPGGAWDRLPDLLRLATWGNRMDLSYAAASERGTAANADDLLVDDAEATREHLFRTSLIPFIGAQDDPDRNPAGFAQRGLAHIILDNAGTELAMDLVLTDALLTGYCDVVVLHTKAHPTFVSDATNEDVLGMMRRFELGPHGTGLMPEVADLGERLRGAFEEGRIRLGSHVFWNSPYFMWEMPRQLASVLDGSQLVIVKGDANYRRLVGDALWPATTHFADVVRYFPAPVLALRTLKSDPIVGLTASQVIALEDADADWRTNGQRGVIQLHNE